MLPVVASKEFDRQGKKERDRLLREQKKRQSHALHEVERAIKAAGKAIKPKHEPAPMTINQQVKVCLLLMEVAAVMEENGMVSAEAIATAP